MNFNDILELAKKKLDISTNKELSAYMGFSQEQGFYDMKNGRGGLKDKTIRKLMDATGLDAYTIEGAWKAEHARDEKVRESYQNFLNKVATAIIAISTISALPPENVQANKMIMKTNPQHYILC